MKSLVIALVSSLTLVTAAEYSLGQVAGSSTIGVSIAEMKQVHTGWSAKKQILGRAVFNEANERVGTIDDLIISPDKTVSYAIVGTGGFVGLRKHDVAVPMGNFKDDNGKLILPGATKDTVKGLPAFEYAR